MGVSLDMMSNPAHPLRVDAADALQAIQGHASEGHIQVLGTKCPTCGREGLVEGTRTLSRTLGGRTYAAVVPAQVCPHCGEGLVSHADLGRFEAAVVRALVGSGAHDGATIKWMRKVAGLRAADLAELLGVSAKTVSRWETGETPIDRATLHILGRLAVEAGEGQSETADALRAMATPATLPPHVLLRAAS